jgi:hypothetical protein
MTTALVAVFNVADTVFDQGAGRIGLQQRTRETLRRLSPILACAVPATEDAQAILTPAIGASGTSVEFTTTSDVLGSIPFDPRAPVYVVCRIAADKSGDLVLSQLDAPGGHPLHDPAPRVLARGLSGATFTRTSVDQIAVHLSAQTSVRNARGQQRMVTCALDGQVQIPYYGIHQ